MAKSHKKLPEKHSKLVENFYPKTDSQRQLIRLIEENEIVVTKGLPGSGKTYVTLATALNLLGDVYKKIILVKSVVTLPGEEIGFIKGSTQDKMAPFMMSYTWNIDKLLGPHAADELIDKGLLQIIPLAFFRGLSIDSAIVIIDESQNLSLDLFKTIITRIGENCKYVFLGDTEQIDRKKKSESCLQNIIDWFSDTDVIKTFSFTDKDCVRNPKIPLILNIFDKYIKQI